MQAQLRRARTLEAMGSLVAGVAHEVRNPLFSISATVDALEASSASGGVRGVRRAPALPGGPPDPAHAGPPGLRQAAVLGVRHALADVVRRAAAPAPPSARERQVTVERIGRRPAALDVDGARMEQAFENLLANAIQHAPAGSAVRVHAALDARTPEPRVRCTVEDEGPGLSPHDLERVFEPFFSRRKGGTGLGLPIVQRVAEAHGAGSRGEPAGGRGALHALLPAGAELGRARRA